MAELCRLKTKQPRWIVSGLLPDESLSLLVSPPKVGKSTLLKHLAVCVARGAPFLGFETTKSRVLYIDMEDVISRVHEQFMALKPEADLSIDILVARRGKYGLPELDALLKAQKAQKTPYDLIIVDTLFDISPVKDINDYTQTKAAVAALEGVVRPTGAHVICAHHANKGIGNGAHRVLGSTAIFGTVDALLLLGKTPKGLTFTAELRHSPAVPKTVLIRNGSTFSLGKVLDGGTQSDSLHERVESLLFRANQPVDIGAMIDTLNVSRKSLLPVLSSMVKNKTVICSGPGTKGSPRLYALSEDYRSLMTGAGKLFSLSKN